MVNAGSVLEANDQRGLAHFLEHTAFNGTTNFKKNDLVSYLQSIGVRFGADLNAYTGFDETVYILPVPTDTARILDKAFDILEDWAHGQIFDSTEVVKERGVVLEEWRGGKGAGERLPDCVSLRRTGLVHRDARQELDQRHGLAADHAERRAIAVVVRARHRAALGGKVVEQSEKERQVFHRHPRLVHGQDESALRRLDQPVGIGHALGDALGRNQRADIVVGHKAGKLGRGERGVDGHLRRLFGQLPRQLEDHPLLDA